MNEEDYTNIENWTKAKLKEELERLEPIVNQISKQLTMMDKDDFEPYNFTSTEPFTLSTSDIKFS